MDLLFINISYLADILGDGRLAPVLAIGESSVLPAAGLTWTATLISSKWLWLKKKAQTKRNRLST